jgi:tripartite-type tricarboxylate transporter receptor subunit TctC
MRPIKSALAALALLAPLALAGGALAQSYPSRTVTMVSAVPPGGILDWLARTMAAKLQERWGQPVIVESKPGAGGWIAIQAVQKAAPDGHTLFVFAQGAVSTGLFIKDASFTPGTNIQALTPAFYAPYVIIIHPSVPAKNLKDFIAYAKANPGKLNWAAVPKSTQYLDTYSFVKRAGIDVVLVPYQGGAPSLRSLLANETQAYFGATLGLEQQVQGGKVVALAVTSAKRYPLLPEIPTVKEAIGLDMDTSVQYGFFTTQGTPKAVVDKIAKDMTEIVSNPDLRAQIQKQGYEPLTMSPEEWTRSMLAEYAVARATADAAGIKPE